MYKNEGRRRRTTGVSAERELVSKLWKQGFAVIRGPASGSRIKKGVYPDIVAIKNRHVFVIEVKKRAKLDHIYIDREQIEKLKEFARRAGGEPLIAVKVAEKRVWKAVPISNVKEVSMDKCRIDKGIIEQAEDLMNYLNSRINLGLDSYLSK
uniref:Crossover junction endodeoxyribonuclease Hjc n=1 Tax=Ignisphaera aggregans TaxID=334771 RepID=A0A7C2Z229_9CREN